MKTGLIAAIFLSVLFSACTNADPKRMAVDVCNCMEIASGKLSPDAKRVLVAAYQQDDVSGTVEKELQPLDDSAQLRIRGEITDFDQLLSSRKVSACLQAIDRKYSVRKAEEETLQKELVVEMQKHCDVGTAVYRYAVTHRAGARSEAEGAKER